MDKKRVILMCGSKDCCPEVIIDNHKVIITDDFGGNVTLTKEQFSLFKEKIQKGEL